MATKQKEQIPYVDYLRLAPSGAFLQANECKNCGARYFDRRNACASCFCTDFKKVRVKSKGEVTSFTIVQMGPQPYVSAIVDCDGTSVRATLVGVEPTPDAVELGMKVKLVTYPVGEKGGVEAVNYGFAPV